MPWHKWRSASLCWPLLCVISPSVHIYSRSMQMNSIWLVQSPDIRNHHDRRIASDSSCTHQTCPRNKDDGYFTGPVLRF